MSAAPRRGRASATRVQADRAPGIRTPRTRTPGIRALLAAALLAATALGSTACAPSGGSPGGGDAPPSIVVTTNILGDVVEELVGDTADVTTLMRPNADPHSFEISAQEAAALDRADLVVSNGLGLEEGLQHHLDRVEAAGGAQFVAGAHITPLSGQEGAATADPHFWTDPTRMIEVVDALGALLASGELPGFDGAARAEIGERTASYAARLTALDAEIEDRFAAIPSAQRALVTNHHVFAYLAERYGFRVLGTAIPGGTTLAAPSAADLRSLVTAIGEAGVPAIFAETSAPDRLMQVLAEEADIEVRVVPLFTESLSEPGAGAESYTEMLATNAERIASGLAPSDQ